MDHDEPAIAHVGQQDADDAHGQVEIGGQIGDRGGQAAASQHAEVLRLGVLGVRRDAPDRRHQGNEVKGVASRPGAPAGQRIRADHRARLVVQPSGLRLVHGPNKG
jgi:hypothetical protein